MTTAPTADDNDSKSFFGKMNHFPPVIKGKINMKEFIEASSSLVALIELNGKLFTPVKYDVQGNIEKIKKCFQYDDKSCLLELMLEKRNKDLTGAEAVLWLNRALLFMEIFIGELIATLQRNQYDVSMKELFTVAYEGSVKKYHNWVTQKIFHFICKMCGTLPQYLSRVGADHDMETFVSILVNYNHKQHMVRSKIDDFFKEHNVFDKNT